jgi:uncharacterized membrane protein
MALGVTASAVPVVVAGVAGNIVDSILGATLERRGILTNGGVNLSCAIAGAATAAAMS